MDDCKIHKVNLESIYPQRGKPIPFEINFDTSPFSFPNYNLNFMKQDFGKLINVKIKMYIFDHLRMYTIVTPHLV